ncbi:MAG: hypothetical protein ACYTGH_12515, partial [Planctomycetota bacterium]
ADESWYPIYDKVKAAGKCLWIAFGGTKAEVAASAERLTRRYGADGLYLLAWQDFTESETRELLAAAEQWG